MTKLAYILLSALLLAGLPLQSAGAAGIGVVASIKPVHSLVAGVMGSVGSPYLIVKGAGSPHTYSLKPSDAEALQNADVVFWVGDELELFLERAIDTLATQAEVVWLIDTRGLTRLAYREGGPFEGPDGEEEAASDHRHEGHDHGSIDMHFWLDPENAKAMVDEIESTLSDADPANAKTYKANAETMKRKLNMLDKDIAATLAPVKDRKFVVFHDAYQYFEERYGLKAAGSVTISPDRLPGARRITEIKSKVKELGATCVFIEPQFEPKLITVIIEGTAARIGVLDPLGADLEDGPGLYFTLMRNMANAMQHCLSQ